MLLLLLLLLLAPLLLLLQAQKQEATKDRFHRTALDFGGPAALSCQPLGSAAIRYQPPPLAGCYPFVRNSKAPPEEAEAGIALDMAFS